MARLRPEQLAKTLSSGLAPVYLVSGDDTLLVQDACDHIRQAARAAGFSERDLHHTDNAGFDWQVLYESAMSLSLFADKKLIEIRIPNGKVNDAGSAALKEYCDAPPEDTLLLIVTPKLDKRSQNSRWCKAIDGSGAYVAIWPIPATQLPRWLQQRLRAAGLRADGDAIEVLSAKVEGNLLAAVQEIEKLKLAFGEGHINAEQMTHAVADSARFDVFGLMDKTLAGDSAAAAASLQGLRAEGTEPTLLLWVLGKEVRALSALLEGEARGQALDRLAPSLGIWDRRKPLYRNALRRQSIQHLHDLQTLCATADRAIKGLERDSVWPLLLSITLGLAEGSLPTHRPNILHELG